MRLPRAVRPLENEYKVIGHVLSICNVYEMTKKEFIACVMEASGGFMNPARVDAIYTDLMSEAGLTELKEYIEENKDDHTRIR